MNKEDSTITINSNIYPHTPQHIAKIFSKIAVSLVGEEILPQFSETVDWLRDNNSNQDLLNHPFHFCIRRIGQRRFTHPLGFLMKKRKEADDTPAPEFVLLFWYGLFQYQIFIPYNANDEWLFEQKEIFLPIENKMSEFKYINGQLHTKVDIVDLRFNTQTTTKKEAFSTGFTPTKKNR